MHWIENALDWHEFTYETSALGSHSQLVTPEVSWVCWLNYGKHFVSRLKFTTQRLAPLLEDIQRATKWIQFEKYRFRLLQKSPVESQTPWLCSIILEKTLPVRRIELEPINDQEERKKRKRRSRRKVLLVIWQTESSFTGAECLRVSTAAAKEQLPLVTQLSWSIILLIQSQEKQNTHQWIRKVFDCKQWSLQSGIYTKSPNATHVYKMQFGIPCSPDLLNGRGNVYIN